MKTFLTKVVWFILPLICISIWLESELRQIDNQYKYKKSYLDKNAPNIDILILGSSHAYYDINPDYIDGTVFNAGAVSQSLDLDFAILNKYKEGLTELKSIVIPISYFSFYGQLKDSPEKWRMKDYVLYYDLDLTSSLNDHFEILSIKPKNNLKKLYRAYTMSKNIRSYSSLGWGNNYLSKGPIDLELSGRATAARHSQEDITTQESKALFDNGVNSLVRILELAKEKNIEVLLFTPPSYESYVSNINEKQLNQVIDQIKKLNLLYPHCRYVNYLNDNEFNADDFYDSDHLNHSGAKKLSTMLNQILSE